MYYPYTPILVSDYVPMDYPEIVQWAPEPPKPAPGFVFNSVSTSAFYPDMSKGQYSLEAARAAYQAGVPYDAILEMQK